MTVSSGAVKDNEATIALSVSVDKDDEASGRGGGRASGKKDKTAGGASSRSSKGSKTNYAAPPNTATKPADRYVFTESPVELYYYH